MEEKTKIIKINGIKTRVVLPPKMNLNESPKEVKSMKNHPKGLFLTL